jgi:hypothetical protein
MSTLRVDRIEPYLSSSVSIEGAIQANAATTGSNTFVGDQNIQGTLTASLQDGYVWVGGAGNISTLAATSSFGGGGGTGDGFPFTGSAQITGSLGVTGSVSITGQLSVTPVSLATSPPAGFQKYELAMLSGSNNILARATGGNVYWVPFPSTLNVSSSAGNSIINPTEIRTTSTLGTTISSLSSVAVSNRPEDGKYISISGNPTTLSGLTSITNPAIVLQSGSEAIEYYAPIQFQSSQSFSDGRVTFTRNVAMLENIEITGSLTASLQQGYVWVGDVNGRTTTVATSSFGGGGAAFPFTGDAQITGSLGVSGATTIGGELSVTPALLPNSAPGGLVQFIIPFLSGSTNVIARDSDNALYWQPAFNLLAVSASTGNVTTTPAALNVNSSTTGSSNVTSTRVVSNFGAGRNISIAGDAAGTALNGLTGITNPSIIIQSGSAGLPPQFYAPIQFQASQSFTDGRVTVTRPLIAQQQVEIGSVMQLAGLDPLPAGGVGQLAVSASNLYYNNGSSWTQIN